MVRRGVAKDTESRLVYTTERGRIRSPEDAEPHETPSTARGVRLRLDRRASGRLVTLVTGLPGPQADLQRLAKRLKAACGSGGTLKDGTIELQGDHRDKVEGVLRSLGVASKRAGG